MWPGQPLEPVPASGPCAPFPCHPSPCRVTEYEDKAGGRASEGPLRRSETGRVSEGCARVRVQHADISCKSGI